MATHYFPEDRVHFTWDAGAEPSTHRRDAVAATVALIAALQRSWEAIEAESGLTRAALAEAAQVYIEALIVDLNAQTSRAAWASNGKGS